MTGFDKNHPNYDPSDGRKQYIFYNDQTGEIKGTTCHSAQPPKHPCMLVVAPWETVLGMKVNLHNKTLEPIVYDETTLQGFMQKYTLADILIGIQNRDKKLFKEVDKIEGITPKNSPLPVNAE